ncbi:hypothetical protein CHS0354_004573 [Potamilus streckersoni]|uniref:ADP-ribosylglycohydrolase n=1 Tax=Potamilus streckersoni TaxID=2493646 RepID=A0AAE0S5C3_9BIVA|nr:hypothetical protein CHS0354_004573 [Potamilus streckersoni]
MMILGEGHPICRLFVKCCTHCGGPLLSTIRVKTLMQFWPIGKSLSGAGAAPFVTLFVIGRFYVADTPQIVSSILDQSKQYSDSSQSVGLLSAKQEESTEKTQISAMSETLRKAKEGALWGAVIADALSMPVHWYYNTDDIKHDYNGWLTGYRAPNKHHPSSIITISAVDGSGRSGWHEKCKPVIGSVILHDKLKYWTSEDRFTHYHQGMMSGDSTLNTIVALHVMKTIQRIDPNCHQPDREVRGEVLADYVKFMTSPGSHNDTYAESYHRSFFKDWSALPELPKSPKDLLEFAEKRYASKSKGSQDSQLVVIGALVSAIPWILRNAHKNEAECAKETVEFIKLTHPVPSLIPFVDLYARLLHAVLNGHDLRQEVLKVLGHSELGGPRKREMIFKLLEKAQSYPKDSEAKLKAYQSATEMLGSACYIEGALSSMLFLALEFADDFQGGVLANANCGGENCHRGSALGALLGASAVNKGQGLPQHLKDGLESSKLDLINLSCNL